MKKIGYCLLLIGCSQQEFSGKVSTKVADEQIKNQESLENDGITGSSVFDKEKEQTTYGMDGNGKPIIGLDPIFKTPIIGQDKDGKPILGKGGINDKGEPILGKSQDGKIIIGYDNDNKEIVDIIDKDTNKSISGINSNGKIILGQNFEKDSLGNRIYGVDGDGKNIIGYDSKNKKPIVAVNADGSFIYGKGGVSDDGKSVLGNSSDGLPIIGYNKDNKAIVDIKDEVTGKSLSGVFSHGTVILVNSIMSSGVSSSSLPIGAVVDHPSVCGPRTFRVKNTCVPALPVYRWFQYLGGDHFYTMIAGPSCQGKNSLAVECGGNGSTKHGETVNEGKYTFEGNGWYTIENIDHKNAKIHRIYRLYNGIDHLYTNSEDERQNALKIGYKDEGFFWGLEAGAPFTKPIYRWYNAKDGDHFYTMAAGPACQGKKATAPECGGETVNEGGWQFERILTYAFE